MPTASYVVQLPTMTQTTSAVDTSTGAVPAWDVSDAQAITITCANATTAPGPKVQVALTSDPAATFFFLSFNSSGFSQIITTSGIAFTIPVTAYKQLRVISTSIVTANTVHNANKLVIL
jgi:hypothetical protein